MKFLPLYQFATPELALHQKIKFCCADWLKSAIKSWTFSKPVEKRTKWPFFKPEGQALLTLSNL
jgi:hypothetical protein